MTLVHRSLLLRLGVSAAAALTVFPSLPAVAGDGRAAAPPTRSLEQACPADRVDGVLFPDAADSVHGAAITCLSWYGIAQGGTDGRYGADRVVTRAQLATFLARVLDEADLELPEAPEDAFSDDDGNVHEDNLDVLAALGIIRGAGDGTVDPDEPVQRDQMASLLLRLLALIDDEQVADAVEDYFDDDDDNVHEGAINALAGLGIAAGRAQGVFDPGSDVLREQMATFLMRLVDRLVQEGEVRVPATLRLSAEEVTPGQVVQAEVVGDAIATVELVGCTFDGPVVDADPGVDGVQFSLTVPAAFPAEQDDDGADSADGDVEAAEECEFLAIVTFADGSTQELDGELEYVDAEDGSDDSSDDGSDDGSDDSSDDSSDDGSDDDQSDDVDENVTTDDEADVAPVV